MRLPADAAKCGQMRANTDMKNKDSGKIIQDFFSSNPHKFCSLFLSLWSDNNLFAG